MSRWRIYLVSGLILAPVLILVGLGSYYMWASGLSVWLWLPMAVCLGLGYVLAGHWQRKHQLLKPADFTPPLHWTERDRQAWQLVEARAKNVDKVSPADLTSFDFYTATAKEMSQEMAQFFHPNTPDAITNLTLPEMLAVIELAAHDMAELVDQYMPGGHLLTIRDLRRARAATEWYQTANKVYWAISALVSPINTGIRYAASQVGLSRPFQVLQQNLLAWFYTAYLQRLGTYLIDLNSGRLRVGAARYRELLQRRHEKDDTTVIEPPSPKAAADTNLSTVFDADGEGLAAQVQVTVLGQVKVGKSSLINALLGEQLARTDVVPMTGEITRYELGLADNSTKLVLLDTVGYGHAGPRADQLKATQEAARKSDLLILVLHARNPARKADLELLEQLQSWFVAHPDAKKPPILGVLSQIDLLTPAMEWSPPYNWQEPRRPKEEQIRQALDAATAQLGEHLTGMIPVCAAPGKVYGVEEWLLPAIANQLDEAHAVAMLRCLRAEIDAGKIRKVFSQMLASGKGLVRAVWEMRPK